MQCAMAMAHVQVDVVACFCSFFLRAMALSGNFFSTLNRTFRKHPRKMDEVAIWENVYISIKIDENGVDSPQEEILLDVVKKLRLIHIEYVHVVRTLERNRYIQFRNIEQIRSPTVNTIMLDLEGGEKVTFVFGTQGARDDFYEAVTIVSSDSGNSEGSS